MILNPYDRSQSRLRLHIRRAHLRSALSPVAIAIALTGATIHTTAIAGDAATDVVVIESGRADIGSEALIVEKGRSPAQSSRSTRTVATLSLRNRATLEFIDSGDGYIDIAERTAAHMPFVSQTMLARSAATPLEIFIALGEGQTAPTALVADHVRRAGGTQPRTLSAPPSATLSFDDSVIEPYVCDVYFTEDHWMDDWEAAFAGVTAYSAAAYIHHYPAYTFYPGAAVYYGTGTNRQTYLGACNGSHDHDVTMRVDRWVVTNVTYNPSPQPPTVTWGWGQIDEVLLEDGQKYTYYSGHPNGRYRGRVEGPGGLPVPHQGVAAAWTPSLHLGIATP